MGGKFQIEQFQIKGEYGIDYFHLLFHYLNMNPKLVDVLVLLLKCYYSCTITFNVLFYVCSCIVITIIVLLLLYGC
jgi:hypothetical protein